MVTLPIVPIPGFREAVQREQSVRETAFLGGLELVCGVVVRPFSLGSLILLDQAKNGFVLPLRFDNDSEIVAHAIQVLYFCSPKFKAPISPKYSFFGQLIAVFKQQRFIRSVLRKSAPAKVISEVEAWIDDSMMDCPSGSSEGPKPQSYAAFPAYIIDRFAEGGMMFTESEIMNMPLRRLWQHWRLVRARTEGYPLTNPSDELAVNFLSGKSSP